MQALIASTAEIEDVARRVRLRVLDHTVRHNGGYLSQACSASVALTTLYLRLMQLGPSEGPFVPPPFAGVPGDGRPRHSGALYNGRQSQEHDRFIFSPAHYALVLYSVLIEVGRLADAALEQFNVDGSTVEMIGAEHSPGFEISSGSLGQALSCAGGIALARKLRGDAGRVWVYMSDGEFQEGQTWEAIAALGFHGLTNVTAVVDVNGQQCDGPTSTVMSIEPLADRIRAFGASAIDVDGHDVDAIATGARDAQSSGRPSFVLCRTSPTFGLPILEERAPLLHYLRFVSADERARYAALLAELTR